MAEPTIGVLYGGGNVVTWQRALEGVLKFARPSKKVIVFSDGFTGFNDGRFYVVDSAEQIDPHMPGTFAGSSRDELDPARVKGVRDRLVTAGISLDGLIGCCGNDHLKQLEAAGIALDIPVIGWPKTMDNDLSKTLFTLGYPTAALRAVEAARRGALAGYNYNRAHILTFFGRDTDWIVAAAGLWGFADIVIGSELRHDDPHTTYTKVFVRDNETGKTEEVETVGYNLQYILEKVKQAKEENKQIYGKSFCVVAAAESGKIHGISGHVDKSDIDRHGNPKLNPENLYLALRKALKKAGIDASGEAITYDQLRFSEAIPVDAKLSTEAGSMATQRLLSGKSGECVVIRHDGNDFNFGFEALPDVYNQRFLRPEGWIDYTGLQVTPGFERLYECILGPVGKRETHLYKNLKEQKV